MVDSSSAYPTSKDDTPPVDPAETLAEADHANLHLRAFNQGRAIQNLVGVASDYTASGAWSLNGKTLLQIVSDLATKKLEVIPDTPDPELPTELNGHTLRNCTIIDSTFINCTQDKLQISANSGTLSIIRSAGVSTMTSSDALTITGTTVTVQAASGMGIVGSGDFLYVRRAGVSYDYLTVKRRRSVGDGTPHIILNGAVTLGSPAVELSDATQLAQVYGLATSVPFGGTYVGIPGGDGTLTIPYGTSHQNQQIVLAAPPVAVVVSPGAQASAEARNVNWWVADGTNPAYPAPTTTQFVVGGLPTQGQSVRVNWVAIPLARNTVYAG